MDTLGIERLCVFGMPPVEFVHLAADLNCRYIAIALTPTTYNPHGYPLWSLRDDAKLRREMNAAMRDRGVSISLLEGFGVQPGKDVRDYAADLAILRELGGTRINATSVDRDLSRTFDQFASLAELAGEFGIETDIEVSAGPIKTLEIALRAVRHVNRPDFRLLIDTMHYIRRNCGTVQQLAAVDPAQIGYVQLCDAPVTPAFDNYIEEALHERRVPGTGDLPLLEMLRVLPPGLVIGLEVPQRSLVEAGYDTRERVSRCVEATRAYLAQLDT
jgi:sugar phosphate isomerase/epimerase